MTYLNRTMGNKISPAYFAHFMSPVPLIFDNVINVVQSETFGEKIFSIELILVKFVVQATSWLLDATQLIHLIWTKQYFNSVFSIDLSCTNISFFCQQSLLLLAIG